MSMWHRFTEDVRNVIMLGQKDAVEYRSSHVGNEHLLLGVLTVDESRGRQLFGKMDIDVSELRGVLLELMQKDSQGMGPDGPRLSPKAKRTLELAAEEARRLRADQIEVEHVFLGLFRDGEMKQILQARDIDLNKIRKAVREVLNDETIGFNEELYDVIERSCYWANLSQGDIWSEQLLLSLLERREDLLVEILGLDVLALKKARHRLAVKLNLQEEAAHLRDEIGKEHS